MNAVSIHVTRLTYYVYRVRRFVYYFTGKICSIEHFAEMIDENNEQARTQAGRGSPTVPPPPPPPRDFSGHAYARASRGTAVLILCYMTLCICTKKQNKQNMHTPVYTKRYRSFNFMLHDFV